MKTGKFLALTSTKAYKPSQGEGGGEGLHSVRGFHNPFKILPTR